MSEESGSKSNWNREGIANIFVVALSVCLVCSIVVSLAAVALKPMQDENRELARKRNVLVAAGLLDEGAVTNAAGQGIAEIFDEFEVRVVELDSGQYTDRFDDPAAYDSLRAARDPALSRALAADEDIATLSRLETYGTVYIKRSENGAVDTLVLPVRGYGLWGTLFGYLALKSDLQTIAGIGFYTHKETPGLGGEVDNPGWKAQWVDVDAYDAGGDVAVSLVKTRTGSSSEVDALSGATMTTRGVENLVHFWLGDLGYGPFLNNLRNGDV